MQFTQSGLSLSFEVTYDNPSLFVGLTVFDDSGGSPSQVGSVIAMSAFKGNSYRAKFTASAGKSYLFHKAVYTDGTYTTIDTSYSQASETIRSEDIAGILLNAVLASYNTPGTVGAAIGQAGGGATSPVNLVAIIEPTCGLISTDNSKVRIIQGGACQFTIRLINIKTGDPFDLTSCTALTTCFLKADQTELVLAISSGITIASALLGKITVALTAAQSQALAIVDSATLELAITLGSADPIKIQIPTAYSVVQSVC